MSEPMHILGVTGGHGDEKLDCATLMVSTEPMGPRARIFKRLFDLVIAGGAVIALSPLMLIIALRSKLEGDGPALFLQRHLGRRNQFF